MTEQTPALLRNPIVIAVLAIPVSIFIVVACALFGPNGLARHVPSRPERIDIYRDLARRSQGLIAAIKRFHLDRGRPPKDLQELVPDYMPAIPETGIPQGPSYDYTVFPAGGLEPFVWYDLGPADDAVGQAQLGTIGPPERAVLIVRFHSTATDRAVEARTDRLAKGAENEAFDPETWLTDRLARQRMVTYFLRDKYPQLKTMQDLTEALGEPDGEGVHGETPWELSVRCYWQFWDGDRAFYWPTEKYRINPRFHVPIRDWIYERDNF